MEVKRFGRRRWLALPYTDYCPPLSAAGEVTSAFVQELDRARLEAGVSELAVRAGIPGDEPVVTRRSVSHLLDLEPGRDAVFKGLRSSHRNYVRKAEREGAVTFRWAEARGDVSGAFYQLHLDTRRRLGKPVQKKRFFELFWEHVVEPGLGQVALASVDGQPVAGAVFLTWNRVTVYLYGASAAAFWRLQPNSVVFWRAIEAACERGDRLFDFGRSNMDNEGLRSFKRGWGAAEQPLVYSSLGGAEGEETSEEGRVQRVAEAMIRRSPAPVARKLGELLYPLTA